MWPSRQNSKVGDSFILIFVALGVSNFQIAIKPSFISVSHCLLPPRTSWGASRLRVLTMVPAFPLSCLRTCELLTNVSPLDRLARVVRHRAGSSETGSPRRITIGNFKPVKKSVHILEQSLRALLPLARTRAQIVQMPFCVLVRQNDASRVSTCFPRRKRQLRTVCAVV